MSASEQCLHVILISVKLHKTFGFPFACPYCLVEPFCHVASERKGFADTSHLCSERGGREGEFLKLETGDFHSNIVQCRFKAGRALSRDLVHDLIKGVADGKFRTYTGDGESCRFGCKRG